MELSISSALRHRRQCNIIAERVFYTPEGVNTYFNTQTHRKTLGDCQNFANTNVAITLVYRNNMCVLDLRKTAKADIAFSYSLHDERT